MYKTLYFCVTATKSEISGVLEAITYLPLTMKNSRTCKEIRYKIQNFEFESRYNNLANCAGRSRHITVFHGINCVPTYAL